MRFKIFCCFAIHVDINFHDVKFMLLKNDTRKKKVVMKQVREKKRPDDFFFSLNEAKVNQKETKMMKQMRQI